MVKKMEVKQAMPIPGRRARALKNSPHAKVMNADKTSHITPSRHVQMNPGGKG